jgi:ribosomal biogenesis protein LAS1
MKTITRDASLRNQYKKEVNIIIRDIERWISETKVAASIIAGEVEWDAGELAGREQKGQRDDIIDFREKWALERFCDALLEKGGLVPLSKKYVLGHLYLSLNELTFTRKRVFPEDRFWPPQLSVSVWTPLLKQIQLLHADFPYTLCTRILSLLLPVDDGTNTPTQTRSSTSPIESKRDPSYDICLARWVVWSITNLSNPSPDTMDGELEKDVVIFLMQSLGRMMGNPRSKDTKVYVRSSYGFESIHASMPNSAARESYFKLYLPKILNMLLSQNFSQNSLINSRQ